MKIGYIFGLAHLKRWRKEKNKKPLNEYENGERDVVTIHLLFVDTSWLFLYFFIYTTWALNTINDLNRPRTFFFLSYWCYCWCCFFSSSHSIKYGWQFAGIYTGTECNTSIDVPMVTYETYREIPESERETKKHANAHVHGNTKRVKIPSVFCLILSFLIPYRFVNIPAIEITITTMPIICATSSCGTLLSSSSLRLLYFLRLQFLLLCFFSFLYVCCVLYSSWLIECSSFVLYVYVFLFWLSCVDFDFISFCFFFFLCAVCVLAAL